MAIQKGTIVKSYKILELLGRGGMAEVYKARHVDLDVDVAVKFIRMERFPQDILRSVAISHEPSPYSQPGYHHEHSAAIPPLICCHREVYNYPVESCKVFSKDVAISHESQSCPQPDYHR